MGGDLIIPVARQACFFNDGLRFKCVQCGRCCVGDSGTIYVSAEEICSIASHLGLAVTRFTDRCLYPYKDSYSIREDRDGRCHFYDDGCRIYEVRPLQCRTWPFWFSNLRTEDRWRRIRRKCPGIGKGRLHTCDEILRSIQMTTHI